jgi:hypothetical protein
MADRAELSKGQTVFFGRPNGEKTKARVVRLNGKSATLECLEDRGAGHVVGAKFRCAYVLIYATAERPRQITRKARRRAPIRW